MWGDINLTNDQGFRDAIRKHARNNFQQLYGADLHHFFRPFTTNADATGYARYRLVVLPVGQAGATAGGLNPFGNYTLQEGVISGTGIGPNIGNEIDPSSVRALGFRGPMQLVGWGYDQFGYPAPNYASGWGGYQGSGAFGTVAPSSGFLGTGYVPTYAGNNVSPSLYRAGPVDLRWNPHFGVWGGAQSVYAAHILSAQYGSVTSGSLTGHYPSTGIKYSVRMFDGVANQMTLTGVQHIGSRPTGYLISPLSSGDFCFIVHTHGTGNMARFGVWAYETPGSEECQTAESLSIYGGAGDGAPWDSSGILYGNWLFEGLAANPIPLEYGGLGVSSIAENQILVGHPSGYLVKKTLMATSGISVFSTSGTIAFGFASGVDFSVSGINTTITELQGLTVPLSIAQGGTGSATKIFVDTQTSQVVSGVKTLLNTLRLRSGTASNPSISWTDDVTNWNAGIHLNTGTMSVHIDVLGSGVARFGSTGVFIDRQLIIQNRSDPATSGAAVQIYGSSAGSGLSLIEGFSETGNLVHALTHNGINYSKSLRNYPDNDLVPVLITQSSTGLNPLEIYDGSTRRFSISESKDSIRFDENVAGATGGYIKIRATSGNRAGFIDLSPSGGYDGGYINTVGGGNIDTQLGFIEFGPTGFRSIVELPVTSGLRRYTFSATSGVIATQQYVANQIGAIQVTPRQIVPFTRAFHGTPPATLYARFDTILGASTPAEVFTVASFDASTDWYMDYMLQMPIDFTGTGVSVNIHYGTSGLTGTGIMGVAFRRLNDSAEDLDTTAHTYDYQYRPFYALPTYGFKSKVSIAVNSGMGLDQVASGEMFVLRMTRAAASGGDNLAGELFMYGFDVTRDV